MGWGPKRLKKHTFMDWYPCARKRARVRARLRVYALSTSADNASPESKLKRLMLQPSTTATPQAQTDNHE